MLGTCLPPPRHHGGATGEPALITPLANDSAWMVCYVPWYSAKGTETVVCELRQVFPIQETKTDIILPWQNWYLHHDVVLYPYRQAGLWACGCRVAGPCVCPLTTPLLHPHAHNPAWRYGYSATGGMSVSMVEQWKILSGSVIIFSVT